MVDKQFWMTSKNILKRIDKQKQRTALSYYPITAVLWLNQVECFYQSLCWVGQSSTRKLRLCKAANLHPFISFTIYFGIALYFILPHATEDTEIKYNIE